jgi:hypothetical protein
MTADATLARSTYSPNPSLPPPHPPQVKLALSVFFLFLTTGGGTAFYMYTEGWSFTNALYWAFTTTSTIGYGNLGMGQNVSGAPVFRRGAMLFALFYVLFSTIFIGFAVKRMYSVYDDVQHAKKRRDVLARMDSIEEVLATGIADEAKGISNGEYLASFLLQMGQATERETSEVLHAFNALDADGSGFLDAKDLESHEAGLDDYTE